MNSYGISAISEDKETGLPFEYGKTISEKFVFLKEQEQQIGGFELEVEVGVLVRNDIRNFLERCKFKGLDFKYQESKYLLESKFIVKGNTDDVREIYNYLCNY